MRIQQIFFALLRAGLWGGPLHDYGCFPLSAEEWQKIYRKATQHAVQGILFDAFEYLDHAYLPPRKLMLTWCAQVESIERRNRWMNNLLAEQSAFFSKHQLYPLLLKGQGLAQCYRRPEHRTCGDIDWYFPSRESFCMANRLIAKQGIAVTSMAGYSALYDWKGCEVDHHRRLFDFHNPFTRKYLERLVTRKTSHSQSMITAAGYDVPVLEPTLQLLQVNAHILKHLLSFGIGLRQLCDAARLCAVHHHHIDGTLLQQAYAKTRTLKWVEVLHRILVDHIGLPEALLPFPLVGGKGDGRWMLQEVWNGGNFGFYDETHPTIAVDGRIKRKGKVRKIWQNFRRYFPYAPAEAFFFPIVQLYSGLTNSKEMKGGMS